MEQKSYKKDVALEIVLVLLNGKFHAREIARKVGINHMNIVRKLKELLNCNVVDYLIEGKNKVYFLKRNIEAYSYVRMAEDYKAVCLVKAYPHLAIIFERILKDAGNVKQVVVFGSYSKFSAKQGSDIDVYVGTQSEEVRKKILAVDSKLSVKIGKFDGLALLGREIVKNHVIIKGTDNFYEKNKFFSGIV